MNYKLLILVLIVVFLAVPILGVSAAIPLVYAGKVSKIILPTFTCPFPSYVIVGPVPATITPIPPKITLKPGDWVLGVHLGTNPPTCPGRLLVNLGFSGHGKSGAFFFK